MRRQLLEVGRPHEDLVGNMHVPEVARDVHVLAHRAADDAHLPADGDRDVDRLLHAVHVRRERRDEDAALSEGDDLAKRLADDALRRRDPRTFRVRRVAEHQVDALVAELREPADVGLQTVDGRVVELPVAGVNDAAGGRLEHDGDAVRHRMRHADERDAERTDV